MKESTKDKFLMAYALILGFILFVAIVVIPGAEEKEEKKVCNNFCSIQDVEPKVNEPGVCICHE